MASLAIGNPWLGWGLTRDPFFQEALTPEADSLHPAEPLHVGRERELVLAANQVLGSASSRAIVQGEYGVGKTSFTNRLKTALADHGVLTHARPVRVTRDMRAREFEAEVLRALLHIRASLPDEQRPREADADTAFWRRAARLVEGEDTFGGGVGALGVSVSQSPGRIAAERRDLALYPEIAGAVERLSVAPGGPAHARRRVLVHVNNLENLTRHAAEAATALFLDLRDYLLIPHSHWLFVGAADLEARVFAPEPPLHSIVPLVVDLAPLTAGEVGQVLARRYQALKAERRRLVPPVAPEAVPVLYARYGGNLRGFLRLLSRATQATPVVDPAPLGAAVLLERAAAPLRAELRRVVRDDFAALERIARQAAVGPGGHVRQASLPGQLGLVKSSVSELVARLEHHRVLRLARESARGGREFRLSPDAEIAFGLTPRESDVAGATA